jgi:polyhydroxyalkanoate synthase
MEEKARMAQPPTEGGTGSGPPRPRKLKVVPKPTAPDSASGLADSSSQEMAKTAAALPTLAPALPAPQPVQQLPKPAARTAPKPAGDATPLPSSSYPGNVDVEALTKYLARLIEEGGRAVAAYLKPREDGTRKAGYSDEVADALKTLGHVLEYWYAEPQRTVEMQTRLGKSYLELFASASRRHAGEPSEPVAIADPRDKRFHDPEWSSNQYFDFLKQAYLLTAQWAGYLVDHANQLDPAVRQKAEFYMRQIVNAASPSNFIFTNPELLRATLKENGENLVRGAHMLAEDIEAGGGELRIRQSDMTKFEVGRNLAITPGKVIYQNELMQLIQYAPSTERVRKRPLLIMPPWINKFYVLDLTPEKSFIKWCVDQGLTVFVISWVNPDQRLARKGFLEYMHEGPLEALDVIAKATGEDKIDTVGYCVGGTLLAITLAYTAAKHDARITSATSPMRAT